MFTPTKTKSMLLVAFIICLSLLGFFALANTSKPTSHSVKTVTLKNQKVQNPATVLTFTDNEVPKIVAPEGATFIFFSEREVPRVVGRPTPEVTTLSFSDKEVPQVTVYAPSSTFAKLEHSKKKQKRKFHLLVAKR